MSEASTQFNVTTAANVLQKVPNVANSLIYTLVDEGYDTYNLADYYRCNGIINYVNYLIDAAPVPADVGVVREVWLRRTWKAIGIDSVPGIRITLRFPGAGNYTVSKEWTTNTGDLTVRGLFKFLAADLGRTFTRAEVTTPPMIVEIQRTKDPVGADPPIFDT